MALFLNALADINPMAAFGSAGLNIRDRVTPELFYLKQLLDTIRIDSKHFVYFRLADTMPITEKADKLVLRRWTPLQGHIVPLSEGIPPVSDKGAVMKYEIHADQYGRYMEFTDRIDFMAVDPIVANYMKEYSIVAMETLDMLAREALMTNCSQYFAGGCANFADIVDRSSGAYPDMRPTMLDLRKIVISMKKGLVKPRANGKYQVICSAEFIFDMIDDYYVQKFMTFNQTTKTMYEDSALVPLFGMEFYETLACPTSGVFVDGSAFKTLQINSNSGVGSVSGALDALTAGYLTQDVGADYLNHANPGTKNAPTSYIPAGQFLTSGGYGDTAQRLGGSDPADMTAGNVEYKVQHILVIGDKALVRTGLSGQDQVQVFVKGLGSAGVNDPINQRQSIGFKINSVGFAVIDSKSVVDYICVPSTVNQIALDTPTLTELTLAFAAGTQANKSAVTVTGAAAGTSTYRYRLNPAVDALYGQTAVNGTNGFVTFTSGGANGVACVEDDIVEVVQVLTSTGLVIARGEHTVLAAEVGVTG